MTNLILGLVAFVVFVVVLADRINRKNGGVLR